MSDKLVQEVVESVHRLAATDPSSPSVEARAREVFASIARLGAPTRKIASAKQEIRVDNSTVVQQIDKMRSAAAMPAENYGRIVSILDGLRHAAVLAERPQNAAVRPRIAEIVKKVAGLFAEVDTVQDLNKPLEQIEKAVHNLYGNQSSNATYYFERRGKGGHRSEGEAR